MKFPEFRRAKAPRLYSLKLPMSQFLSLYDKFVLVGLSEVGTAQVPLVLNAAIDRVLY